MTAESQDTLISKQTDTAEADAKVASVPSGQAGLWRDLSTLGDMEKQGQSWAALMHDQLEEHGDVAPMAVFAFRYDGPSRQLTPVGGSPKGRVASALAVEAAQSAVDNGRPVARGDLPENQTRADAGPMAAAAPLMIKDAAVGVVVV